MPNDGVYVLQLSCGKYYIGSTLNLESRLEYHKQGQSSCAWLQEYTFQNVYAIFPANGKNYRELLQYEQHQTYIMMQIFGIENCRGGAFCQFTMTKDEIHVIQSIIYHLNDSCYNCGGKDHFGSQCDNKKFSASSSSPTQNPIKLRRII